MSSFTFTKVSPLKNDYKCSFCGDNNLIVPIQTLTFECASSRKASLLICRNCIKELRNKSQIAVVQ